MGIMTLALYADKAIPNNTVPIWVILMAATAMSLGTAAGGWRIMKTMGQRVVKLDPVHGFAAETTAASIIMVASHFGMPVFDDARNLNGHHGRRHQRPDQGRSLGSCAQHRDSLGPDDPRDGDHRRGGLRGSASRRRVALDRAAARSPASQSPSGRLST